MKLKYIFFILLTIFIVLVAAIILKNTEEKEQPIFTLKNGGFEDGTKDWNVRHGYSLDCSESHKGSCSIKSSPTYCDPAIDGDCGDARGMWQGYRIPVEEGQRIVVSWYAKTDGVNPACASGQYKGCGGDAGVRIGVDFKKNSSSAPLRAINGKFVSFGTEEWTYRTINGTVRAGEERITLWIQGKPYSYNATAWVDDITLEIYAKK